MLRDTMDMDRDRIDEAVLALLYLGLHDQVRAWKSFDWGAMNRLHAKGLITNPANKAKSVVFTEEGLRRSEAAFREMFTADCSDNQLPHWGSSRPGAALLPQIGKSGFLVISR